MIHDCRHVDQQEEKKNTKISLWIFREAKKGEDKLFCLQQSE